MGCLGKASKLFAILIVMATMFIPYMDGLYGIDVLKNVKPWQPPDPRDPVFWRNLESFDINTEGPLELGIKLRLIEHYPGRDSDINFHFLPVYLWRVKQEQEILEEWNRVQRENKFYHLPKDFPRTRQDYIKELLRIKKEFNQAFNGEYEYKRFNFNFFFLEVVVIAGLTIVKLMFCWIVSLFK